MRIYFSRNSNILQILIEESLTEFTSLKVYQGPVSPLQSLSDCIELHTTVPISLLNISYDFSNHQVGNIFLIGITSNGSQKLIGAEPIVGGSNYNDFYDNIARGHSVRKNWYQKLRKEQTAIYFKSMGATCECYDPHFNNADPSCTTCAGTGRVASYVGSYFDVMIENDYKKIKVRDPNGKRVTIDALEAWVFESPYINDECIIERQNGDRYSVQNVTYKHIGGHLIEESFNLVLLPDSFAFNYELVGD